MYRIQQQHYSNFLAIYQCHPPLSYVHTGVLTEASVKLRIFHPQAYIYASKLVSLSFSKDLVKAPPVILIGVTIFNRLRMIIQDGPENGLVIVESCNLQLDTSFKSLTLEINMNTPGWETVLPL